MVYMGQPVKRSESQITRKNLHTYNTNTNTTDSERFIRGKNLGWCSWDLSRSRKIITFLLEPQGILKEEIYIYIIYPCHLH